MRKAALILSLILTAAACSGTGSVSTTATPTTGSIPRFETPTFAALAALSTVDSCDELLSHFQAEALKRVGPWGLDGGPFYPYPVARGGFLEDVAVDAPAATSPDGEYYGGESAGGPIQGVDYSGTNVQERGVDEPDIAKTDGRRIFTIVNSEEIYYEDAYYGGYGSGAVLVAIDLTDDGPKLAGRLDLRRGWGHEMFLSGDKVFVISNGSRPSAAIDVGPNVWEGDYFVSQVGVTLVSEINVSDLDNMTVTSDLYFDGTYVSARLVDGSVRMVVRTQPTGLEFTQPKGSGLRAEREAEDRNRRVIEDSTIDNWLPYYVLEDHADATVTEGTLLACSDVYLPEESAGLGLTAVLTFDIDQGIEVGTGSAAVFAEGETVYASTDNLYVATNPWFEPTLLEDNWRTAAGDFATTIHRFDTSDRNRVTYMGSGSVTGYLLNQFALSEHEGHLRVATTDAASRWGFSDEQQSFISVLDIEDMTTVGRVGGLGNGEQIYSVRFIGDTGFVVTFRQVDPLYTVDLSQPSEPKVLGELKIPGYSAYLHPVGEDRLLGIGQDATEQGRIEGTQVSLFDISDLAHPALISKLTLGEGGGNSEVEYDHRAFLYWAPAELAVLPIQTWNWDEARGESFFNGAIGIHVHQDEVHLLEKISHQRGLDYWEYGAQVRRSMVIGDELFTISSIGVKVFDTDDLTEVGWVPFTF